MPKIQFLCFESAFYRFFAACKRFFCIFSTLTKIYVKSLYGWKDKNRCEKIKCGNVINNNILYYSMKLAMINKLLRLNKITDGEYSKIKVKIKEELNIKQY